MGENTNQRPYKGKARLPVDSQEETQNSLVSRVGTSISALIREAVLRPQRDGMAAALASATTASSKGSSSAGPLSVLSAASQHIQERPVPQEDPRQYETFRSQLEPSSSLLEPTQQDFDNFVATKNGLPDDYWPDQSPRDFVSRRNGKQKENVEEDGAAVVKLLSNPGYSVDDYPGPFSEPEQSGDSRCLWVLNDETQKVANRIKSSLPPVPSYRTPSPANPLNLLPNFNNKTTKFVRYNTDLLGDSKVTVGSPSLGHFPLRTATTEGDLAPWLNVLTTYQDEVWGDLLPLVKEAREEIKGAEIRNETTLEDSPAVRRLSMILGHTQTPTESL